MDRPSPAIPFAPEGLDLSSLPAACCTHGLSHGLPVVFARGDGILAAGLVSAVIEGLLAIDREAYGDLSQRDNGDREFWEQRWDHRPDMNHVCFVGGQVAGNLHIDPLTEEGVRLVSSGQLGDGEIRNEHVTPPGERPHGLYLMSLVLAPRFQGRGLGQRLWGISTAYWQEQCDLRHCLATIWSQEGYAFFRHFKRADVGVDAGGHPIWRLSISSGS